MKPEPRPIAHVLIIDDCPADRTVYKRWVTRGATPLAVVEAGSVAEGIACAESEVPACILLDFCLPDADGLECLRRLGDLVQSTAIVMLTGEGNETVAVEAMKSGAQDYLPKRELTFATLNRAVHNAMEKASLRRQIQRQQAELEAFARTAAHDLRAPIRHLRGYSDLMLRDARGTLDDHTKRKLGMITKSAAAMDTLVTDLLAHATLGREHTEFEPVALCEVAEQAQDNLRGAIEQAGATVEIEPLPTVMGERSSLVQLMQNLIANALKYRGASSPHVRVRADREDDWWRLLVEDDGIGIEECFHTQIFEAFHRLHSKHEYEGTGLGLATCKKVAEHHGGRIWVTSSPGQGSTFHVTLSAVLESIDVGTLAQRVDLRRCA